MRSGVLLEGAQILSETFTFPHPDNMCQRVSQHVIQESGQECFICDGAHPTAASSDTHICVAPSPNWGQARPLTCYLTCSQPWRVSVWLHKTGTFFAGCDGVAVACVCETQFFMHDEHLASVTFTMSPFPSLKGRSGNLIPTL